MRVILREEVDNLGNAGDMVSVKDGFARNFLLPRGLAVRADERNVKALRHTQRAMEARRSKLEDEAKGSMKAIEDVGRVVVTKTCGAEGKLFGSVTSADIAAAFGARNIEISKRQVLLTEPLKSLGDFDVEIKLGQGMRAGIKVSVEPDAASAELIAKAAADKATADSEGTDSAGE
jgi:large subunit ribosomal protein L9